jgi:hypothetical protein
MNYKSLFYVIYFLSILAILVGVYFDLGRGFITIPIFLVLLGAFSLFYSISEGSRRERITRLITAIFVYAIIVLSFTWIVNSVFEDYIGESFFDLFSRMSGATKFFAFIVYLAFISLSGIFTFQITDSILKGFSSIFSSATILKKRNIIYFLILYCSTILFFAIFYDISYELDPASFRVTLADTPKFHDFLYFSLVTSTSYGTDLLSPISGLARMLVVVQIIISLVLLMIYISYVMSLPNKSDGQ